MTTDLHSIYTELIALFKVAGVEKPEHERVTKASEDSRSRHPWTLRGWPCAEADARDLLAAHFERLWCEVDDKHSICRVRFIGCNDHVWTADTRWGDNAHHDADKLTAILLAMRAKHGAEVKQ